VAVSGQSKIEEVGELYLPFPVTFLFLSACQQQNKEYLIAVFKH